MIITLRTFTASSQTRLWLAIEDWLSELSDGDEVSKVVSLSELNSSITVPIAGTGSVGHPRK